MDLANLFDPDPGDFLRAVWGNGPHSLCYPDGGRFTATFAERPEGILKRLSELQDRDVWFGAHPLRGIPPAGRGSVEDVAEVVAIPADLDWDHPTRRTDAPLPSEAEVRQSLARLGDLAPSIVVHSGHGLQVWWVLTNAVTPEEAEQLGAQLDARLGEVGLENGRPDLASILRVPGTRNHKDPDQPVRVYVESLTDRRFTPEYLHKHLPVASGLGRSGAGTKHRRGAVTDAQQALADLLVVDFGGHSKDVWRDGSIHLVRPGKSAREGSSASIIVGEEGDALLTVFTDHWPGLAPGSYVLGIDGVLHHPADPLATFTMQVTGSRRDELIDVYQGTAGGTVPDDIDLLPIIDWGQAVSPVDELVEGLVVPGRWLQFVAKAKEGKSSLVMFMAIELSLGRHPFDQTPCSVVNVLYCDGEMGQTDLRELIESCGHDPAQLTNLHCSAERVRLDTDGGSRRLLATADRLGAELVVLDGLNGFVNPDASDNDDNTWKPFYERTIQPLKRRGVAVISGDNMGKDPAKGSRGSSVKNDKGDCVIPLRRTDKGVKLRPSHRRSTGYLEELDLQAEGFDGAMPLRFWRAASSWPDGTAQVVKTLDGMGVPLDASRRKAADLLREEAKLAETRGLDATPYRVRNEVLGAAIRYRKQHPIRP